MKGIIIYSNPMWGDNERATYCEYINNASFELTQYAPKEAISCLKGEALESSKAVCSEDDTYDFMTGALISLMKMCGLEKSAKAYAEIFDDTAYGDALIERDKLKRLLCYAKEDINMKVGYLKEKDKEIENLKENNNGLYNLARKYVDEIDQKNHEITSLKSLKISNESLKKDNESFRKTCEKLKEENSRLKNEMHLLMDKNNELVEKKKDLKKKLNAMYGYKEENEKLKLDCEKLQHGYIDTDNVPFGHWDGDILDILFLPCRRCGKPYSLLVDLFKKIDQKKVDAAYKEAYKERRIWCSSREKMWDDIKTFTWKGASCIEVNKADVIDFLEELEKEIPLVHWPTGDKPTAIKPGFNYKMWHECDKVYFFIDDDYVTYGFGKESSRTNVQYVTYLPPMRWDLFKKGRLAVKVDYDNYKEFYEACKKELGKRPSVYPYMTPDDVTISIGKKDGNFEIFTVEDQKKTGRKIVDWEDVR